MNDAASSFDAWVGKAEEDRLCIRNNLAAAGLRVATLPFAQVPHQSRLFLDYLADPTALHGYYPSAVREHYDVAARVPEVLRHYTTDRARLCDA